MRNFTFPGKLLLGTGSLLASSLVLAQMPVVFGGSSGRTKSVVLACPGSAFVPSILAAIWSASWAALSAFLSSSLMPRRGLSPSTCHQFSRVLYNIVDPSDCDLSSLRCSLVNKMPLSPAASRVVFEGRIGWSLRISSSSICSSGVVGCSSVTGTVSPHGMSSIS